LEHGQELVLPPTRRQKFSYDVTNPYWSVVAISDARDYDLSLYSDPQNSMLLARSSETAGSEYVVVDSNHAPLPATYYPTVTGDGAGPNYTIEIDTDKSELTSAPLDVPMTNRDLVTIHDTLLRAGVKYTFRVSAEPDQNPSLYLMQSDRRDWRTWYQDRGQAVAQARQNPQGVPETFTYTAPRGGWYGVVLVNVKGLGSGVYRITRIP
jgi:hypothetical protein